MTVQLRRVLSPRDREVLRLVADGYTRKEIGQRLGITAGTVQNHTEAIRLCVGALNMAHAVYLVYVERRGLPEREGAA